LVLKGIEATTGSSRESNVLVFSCTECGSWLISTQQTGFDTAVNSQDFRISMKQQISVPTIYILA